MIRRLLHPEITVFGEIVMIDAYVYVQDTMADWEIGYITAELNTGRFFRKGAPEVKLHIVGKTLDKIRTMGGLEVTPDCTSDDIIVGKDTLLILPGSNSWPELPKEPVMEKVKPILSEGGTVCAICGATVALAELGLLNDRRHTSNGPGFLDHFSKNYEGSKLYEDVEAVNDNGLITAGSTGCLLWAKLILEHLSLFSEETLDAWYSYFSTGDSSYYYAIENSLK